MQRHIFHSVSREIQVKCVRDIPYSDNSKHDYEFYRYMYLRNLNGLVS